MDLGVASIEETDLDAIAQSPVAPNTCLAAERKSPAVHDGEKNNQRHVMEHCRRVATHGKLSIVDRSVLSVTAARTPAGTQVHVFEYAEQPVDESSRFRSRAQPKGEMGDSVRDPNNDSQNRQSGRKKFATEAVPVEHLRSTPPPHLAPVSAGDLRSTMLRSRANSSW